MEHILGNIASPRLARCWRHGAVMPVSAALVMADVYAMPSKHVTTFAAKRNHLLASEPWDVEM